LGESEEPQICAVADRQTLLGPYDGRRPISVREGDQRWVAPTRYCVHLLCAILLCGPVTVQAWQVPSRAPPASQHSTTLSTLAKPSDAVAQTAQHAPTPEAPIPVENLPSGTQSQPIPHRLELAYLYAYRRRPPPARVRSASPISLFLMGVVPGRTTVIAATEAGAAGRQKQSSHFDDVGGPHPTGGRNARANAGAETSPPRLKVNLGFLFAATGDVEHSLELLGDRAPDGDLSAPTGLSSHTRQMALPPMTP
jgi:hypothetical protein